MPLNRDEFLHRAPLGVGLPSVLMLQPLEEHVMNWLSERHSIELAPELVHDRKALLDRLSGARALFVPPAVRVDARVLLHAPLLRVVACVCEGAENIDTEACERAGVAVVRPGAATAQSEAEFMIGALLALLRRVPVADADGMRVGRELGSLTVGLIGMSSAARATARLLGAFGSRIVGYEPSVHASAGAWESWGVKPLPLRDLLAQSDAVCVQLGDFSRYRRLLGDRLLPGCKPDQVIVSISHADVFDEHVLGQLLRSGRIAAAWLDSVAAGSLAEGRPLHGLGTLQTTPRLASTTRQSRSRSAWWVARRLDALLAAAPARVAEASAA